MVANIAIGKDKNKMILFWLSEVIFRFLCILRINNVGNILKYFNIILELGTRNSELGTRNSEFGYWSERSGDPENSGILDTKSKMSSSRDLCSCRYNINAGQIMDDLIPISR